MLPTKTGVCCFDVVESKEGIIKEFKKLFNQKLPSTYNKPVHFNHCFNRIILDWLFKDCWYNHLDKNKTALSQLSEQQINKPILRMKKWLNNQQHLINDNNASIAYRKDFKANITLLQS